MDLQSLLKSKFITVILFVIVSAVGLLTIQLYLQKKEVDSEVKRLSDKAASLQKDSQELSELIKYLNTPEYQEREAREKLNLKKPGEEVVVLPEHTDGLVASASTNTESNPKKWFNYFFNKQ